MTGMAQSCSFNFPIIELISEISLIMFDLSFGRHVICVSATFSSPWWNDIGTWGVDLELPFQRTQTPDWDPEELDSGHNTSIA